MALWYALRVYRNLSCIAYSKISVVEVSNKAIEVRPVLYRDSIDLILG